MKVVIEFDMDAYSDDNTAALDDLLSDWTYEMRTSRRVSNWNISYEFPKHLPRDADDS